MPSSSSSPSGAKPEARRDGSEQSANTNVVAVVKEYLEQLKHGKQPDRQALVRAHPEFAAQLSNYLEGVEIMHRAAAQVVDAAQNDGLTPGSERAADVPKQLGDFAIKREIGRGGMGIVYEATQLSLGRRVALKVLPLAALLDPKHLERFKNEASAAAAMDHPGIVAVYSVGCERGIHYYAMQYIEGHSLAEVITEMRAAEKRKLPEPEQLSSPDGQQGGALPEEAGGKDQALHDTQSLMALSTQRFERSSEFFRSVARLGVQAAEAIEYAHERGIVHRDIKPSNLLLGRDARLWIADFGLAMTHTSGDLTLSGDLVGTLRYMSPEQATGDRRRLDHRTDIYSLGATLYELATLAPLHAVSDAQQLLRDIAEREPARPRHINPAIPRDLETILLKATSKQRDDRYFTAQAMADDLERFLEHKPVEARRVGAAGRGWRWCRRNPVLAGVSTALLLALLGGTTVATVLAVRADREAEWARNETTRANREANRARSEASIAKARKEQAERTAYGMHLARIAELIKRSPDKSFALLSDPIACPPYLRDFAWGHLYWLCQQERPTLLGHQFNVHDVRFTPDGRTLISAGRDGTVRFWNASTHQQTRSIPALSGAVRAIAVSPDGTILAAAGEDALVHIYTMDTGKMIRTIDIAPQFAHTDQSPIVYSLAFLPDGDRLAVHGLGGFGWWDIRSGTNKVFIDRGVDTMAGNDCLAVAPSGDLVVTSSFDLEVGPGQSSGRIRYLDVANEVNNGVADRNLNWTGPAFPQSMDWSSDGRYLAVCGDNERGTVTERFEIWIWEKASRRVLWKAQDGTRGGLHCVRFSPSGDRLAVAAQDGTVALWSCRPDGLRRYAVNLPKHDRPIERMAFSPDGNWLATAASDGTIKVMDVRPQRGNFELEEHQAAVTSVAVSPDGTIAASGSEDQSIRLWNVRTGEALGVLRGHMDDVACVAFSPSGDLLVSAGWDGLVRLWDPASCQTVAIFSGHKGRVYGLAFSPDGTSIASAGDDRTVRVWDVEHCTQTQLLRGHIDRIWGVTFSADGTRLASASRDRTVRIWDAASGTELGILKGHTDGVFSVAFSPDGSLLASCGVEKDGIVRIWDAHSYQLLRTLPGHVGAVYSIAFSPDGKTLASAGQDGTIKLWDPITGVLRLNLSGHSDWTYSLAFSPDGSTLHSASRDGTVRVWRAKHDESVKVDGATADRDEKQATEEPSGIGVPVISQKDAVTYSINLPGNVPMFDMVFTPHGQQLLFTRHYTSAYVWSDFGEANIRPLAGSHLHVRDLEVSPDGAHVVSAVIKGSLEVWDVETQEHLRSLNVQERSRAAQFSPDGKFLLAAGEGPAIVLLDAKSWQPVMTLQEDGVLERATFSKVGRYLACSTDTVPSIVYVWDMTTRTLIGEWTHSEYVTDLAFSPDENTLAVASDDASQSIMLWDCETRRPNGALSGHASRISALAFLPDGNRLVSSSDDGTVRLWDTRTCGQVAFLDGAGMHYLALSPDGSRLATASQFHGAIGILVWDVNKIQRELARHESVSR